MRALPTHAGQLPEAVTDMMRSIPFLAGATHQRLQIASQLRSRAAQHPRGSALQQELRTIAADLEAID